MQDLTDGMADAIGCERIKTGVAATIIERAGDGWKVTLDSGEIVEGDALIVATEAWAATRLMRDVDAAISDLLESIPCSSSATVSLAFREEDCPFDTRWFGILSPMVEERPILAVTLSSSKWPDRAPAGKILLRGFIGGPGNQHLLETTDDELVETIRTQLVELLGLRADAQPLITRVYRWNGGMPQYTLGHLDRVDEIEQRCDAVPALALAGGAFRGVGIPNCIESGERAVTKVLADLGLEYDEPKETRRGPR
jgi:oxygen-dependent protoporphyrinogen oxidase